MMCENCNAGVVFCEPFSLISSSIHNLHFFVDNCDLEHMESDSLVILIQNTRVFIHFLSLPRRQKTCPVGHDLRQCLPCVVLSSESERLQKRKYIVSMESLYFSLAHAKIAHFETSLPTVADQ